MCDFTTQSSILPFLEQFANTVVAALQSDIWGPIVAHGEKRSIPTRTREDISERLLSDM